ncbi:sensor histidine kinase, partial [Chloroflexota bacterium]
NMRWFAILGVIIATLVASLVFHIGFSILPVFIICAFMSIYNFILYWQVKALEVGRADVVIHKARTYSNIHIILDLTVLTVLLHFTGGIENPFIFFFVLHIIAASIVLSYRIVYLIATLAIFLVALLVGLEYVGVIPHNNLEGFAAPILYREGSYILAVLAVLALILYTTTYMATAISGELRKRQRQVVQLRERLLKQKNGKLKQASREVAKLEEEKDRFLRFISMAAHDLKAPLTAIQGFLWILLGGYSGELNTKQKNVLQRCTYRIKELMELISDLLDIPRIETGQIVQEMKRASLRQAIMDCLKDQRNLAKEKGIKLKMELSDGLPKIQCSIPRLHQVINNLVSNAITYTDEGTVTVRVREESKELQVEIVDTGVGIPTDDLPHIFEDFYRASNTQKKGTGLGLPITKRIVEAHGGRIWVESPSSESNTGCKVSFILPKQSKTQGGKS